MGRFKRSKAYKMLRCRNEPYPNGTTLSSNLSGHGVGFTNFVTPEATTDWNNGQFGQNDSSTDSSSNLFGALDTKTNMTIEVSDSHKSLETGTLTDTSLLLNRHDLQHFVLQRWTQEEIDDFMFFDWKREKVNLF